jgi:hypothetical protein
MDKEPKDEQTQRTETGLEIPVPTREEIEDALAKIAKPQVSTRKGGRRRPKE